MSAERDVGESSVSGGKQGSASDIEDDSLSDAGENATSDAERASGSDVEAYTGRGTRKKRLLRSVAVQAAMVSAAVHFLWAWPRLATPADARPYLFVLGGVFTIAIGVAALRGGEYRRLYALGAGTLFAFLAGYVGWHGVGTVGSLASDPLAIVGKTAEVGGLLAFLALYRLAPPTTVVLERRNGTETGESGSERSESERSGSEGTGSDDRREVGDNSA